jgi:hypothetical protein
MQHCWQILGIICLEPKLDLGNLVSATLATLGLASILLAYRQIRLTRRAQQTQSAIQLFHAFLNDKDRREFLYRLDYSNGPRGWKFDPNNFPNSTDEMHLDHVLYQLSFIGSLLNSSDLTIKDLSWIKPDLGIVLNNPEVLKYLDWLKLPDQLPNHTGFSGAIELYKVIYGTKTVQFAKLERYLNQPQLS